MFPSSETSHMEANTKKDKETCNYAQKSTLMHPPPCFQAP